MLSLFNKNSIKNIEKSVEKYSSILRDDVNLVIRTRYNGKLYTSYVEDIDNRVVVFRCPIDKEELIRFKDNSIIRVEFISYSVLYTTELLITEKIIKDKVVFYKGEISATIEESQKRKNYRLPIVLDLNYTLLPAESENYKGNTLDISAGGMLMETNENINRNSEIKVSIDIDGQAYNIKSTIIGKRTNYRNGTYLYNLKFNNLKSRYRNQINRYVIDNTGI